jgi:hypothetical protein
VYPPPDAGHAKIRSYPHSGIRITTSDGGESLNYPTNTTAAIAVSRRYFIVV